MALKQIDGFFLRQLRDRIHHTNGIRQSSSLGFMNSFLGIAITIEQNPVMLCHFTPDKFFQRLIKVTRTFKLVREGCQHVCRNGVEHIFASSIQPEEGVMSDMFNGLMVIPNLLAVIALSAVVANFSKDNDFRG